MDEPITLAGKRHKPENLLDPWMKRREQATQHRKDFEAQWMVSLQFLAGKQWAKYVPGEHRMHLPKLAKGRTRHTADRLTQNVMAVLGNLLADDGRGRFLTAHDDSRGEDYAEVLDKLLAYGWEREWQGDARRARLARILIALGTGGIRARFDRTQGRELMEVPHRDGEPILDPDEARSYVAEASFYGESANLKTIREGRIVWDVLSAWNLLPPPAVEEPEDFPWELIVRPVDLETLKRQYGERAESVVAAPIEAMNVLGLGATSERLEAGDSRDGGKRTGRLEDHAILYTGYLKPTPDWPRGQMVVFTHDAKLLDAYDRLPLEETSCKPARSGITYFWYWRTPGRFWGRGLVEPGIGPQRVINKRVTQIDETIDRSMPYVVTEEGTVALMPEGRPMEEVRIRPGAAKPLPVLPPGPGAWMLDDIRLQDENIEKALGLRGVTLGDNPTGVTTYSQLALLRETDAAKIDPIAAELRLGLAECQYDSVELTRNWPPDKKLMITGENDRLELLVYSQVEVPADYMVLPAKGGTQLRTTGAELQKINDIWNAALAVGRNDLLEWYVDSLNVGKAQDLPKNPKYEQRHMAALENTLLSRGEPVPVAPFHDHEVHVLEHREDQNEWLQIANEGDESAAMIVQVYEQHIQQHAAMAQAAGPVQPVPRRPEAPEPAPVQ